MNAQPQVPYRRRIKLIKPRLQLKLVGVFVGLSALGFLLQSLHVGLRLSELAANVPEGGTYLMAVMPELPLEILLVSFGMLLPLTIAVGILVTFRIAGPVYRFEKYLKAVIRGEETGPCRIRKGDEFQELCELINQASAAFRERGGEKRVPEPEGEPGELRKAG
jgi:signal peptidase II